MATKAKFKIFDGSSWVEYDFGGSGGSVDLSGYVSTIQFNAVISALTSTIQTDYLTKADAETTYQGLDTDLTAIAGLTGTKGLLKKNGNGLWSLDTNTYLTSSSLSGYATQDYVNDSLPGMVTTGAAGLMSAADKLKLDGIASGANNYTLPLAKSNALGGIKLGYPGNTITGAYVLRPVELDTSDRAYVEITRDNVHSLLGEASKDHSGVMSTTDKARIDTLWNVWSADGKDDTLINKVEEILEVFENYPEGSNIVNALAGCFKKSSLITPDNYESLIYDYDRDGSENVVASAAGLINILYDFETKTSISNTYLKQTVANSTYLKQTDASSTYLNKTAGGTITGTVYFGSNNETMINTSGTVSAKKFMQGGKTLDKLFQPAGDYLTNIDKEMVVNALGYTPPTTNTTYTFTNKAATLAWNTTSTIATVGGVDITVKMPANPDNNTNYYHTTGTWNGLTYTAKANGGAGALAFTIPTGTSSTTVALGNHTHSGYLSTSGGTISGDLSVSDELSTSNLVANDIEVSGGSLTISGVSASAISSGGGTLATQSWVEGKGYKTTDNDTKYSAGTGLSLSGTSFSVKYGTTAGTACSGNDSRLNDSRNAKDVYDWAKASTKPTYTWSEITSKPETFYTLPTASSSTLGGVKVGSNITNSSGTISLTKANVTSALGYTPVNPSDGGNAQFDDVTLVGTLYASNGDDYVSNYLSGYATTSSLSDYVLKTSVSGTSSYIPKFTGTNSVGDSTLSQHTSGALNIKASNNVTTIGSQNSSFCHIYNSLNIPFIFNQSIQALSNNDLGSSAYKWGSFYTSGNIIKNGYTLTLPQKTGTMALTSDIPTDYLTSHLYRPIQVNGTQILANSSSSALNLKAGSNVTISNSSGTVTISATGGSSGSGGGVTLAWSGYSRFSNITTTIDTLALTQKNGRDPLLMLKIQNNDMFGWAIGRSDNGYDGMIPFTGWIADAYGNKEEVYFSTYYGSIEPNLDNPYVTEIYVVGG